MTVFDVVSQQISEPEMMSNDETKPLIRTEPNTGPPLCEQDKKISFLVYILVAMFSLSSWISVNGMWVEVPFFVDVLPEKWSLPSYLVIIIQIANIGPLLYTISKVALPQRTKPWLVIYGLIIIGAISCILLSLFWHNVHSIRGKPHSLALFTLTGFLALVDCTSSVVYLPYMAQFKTEYLTAFYGGEGLSGLLPALIGLLQGIQSGYNCANQTTISNNTGNSTLYQLVDGNDTLRFSISTFFLFLFCVIAISGIAFAILHHVPYCKREHVQPHRQQMVITNDDDGSRGSGNLIHQTNSDVIHDVGQSSNTTQVRTQFIEARRLNQLEYILVLALTCWINAIQNGILPAIQSYACLPYGSLAYMLAIRLSTLVSPLVSFLTFFLPTKSLRAAGLLTLILTALACYQFVLAAMSPEPPLKGQLSGIILVILTSVVLSGCVSYVKVINASVLDYHGGSKALLWCGALSQIGSFVGGLIMFIVINIFSLLHAEPGC